ncbi:hypothetical protein COY27_00765 [Candidatus Woesearchaeota archaeon CG_4_10_14_0_2_um_filter_33_13]|nr:MAG: hypothetical protein COY27_00765 [Candidatus Woesearchaeota archaeon CG_4_10_14_0_2_um_filter_33_13]
MSKKIITFILGLLLVFVLVSSTLAATKTFMVKENDFVKVKPESVDLDGDKVTYYYAPPLDDKGEWQTTYDDAGEYEVEITATDGMEQVSRTIKIIVENKNQAPYLSDNKIYVKETQTVDLKKLTVDPDNDPLTYVFTTPFNNNGVWEPGYDDEGSYVTNFKVSDGEFTTNARVEVEVLKTNQPPIIDDIFSEKTNIDVDEDSEINYYVSGKDNDNDQLTYQWKFDDEIISDQDNGEFYLDFESAGDHILSLTIGDGISLVSKEWTIKVSAVNRKPKLELLPITVHEGEKVMLDLPDVDLDGDDLTYSFEAPLDNEGVWQTTYDDEGEYTLEVIVSDGELINEEFVDITVLNVDQNPVLKLPEWLSVDEDALLNFTINSYDPDGDEVTISFEQIPEGAVFDQETKTLTWTPGYDFIKRKGGLFSDLLNALRLESLFLRQTTAPLRVVSCAKELCTTASAEITIYNINRKPEFTNLLKSMNFSETEKINLNLEAIDPDGDIVRIYYGGPLQKKRGTWKPNYNDEGQYAVYITATDGKYGNTQLLDLNILKENRQPVLKISDKKIVVNEGQQFLFKVSADDADGDNVTIRLNNPPEGASFIDGDFIWEPSYETVMNRSGRWLDNFYSNFKFLNKKYNSERQTIWLEFAGTDGTTEVLQPVEVTVKNVNRVPEVIDYMPANQFNTFTGKEVIFHVLAKDSDNDTLTYTWDFGLNQGAVEGTDTISRTFTSPGKKTVRVSIDDGRDKIEKEWAVNVVSLPTQEVQVTEGVDPFSVKVYVIDS